MGISDDHELFISSSESLYVNTLEYLYSDSMEFYCDIPGAGTALDIAWDNGDLWVASTLTESPILKYDGNGQLLQAVDSSIVPSAVGLAIDDEGYIWASDNDNQMIYRIDATQTGIGSSYLENVENTGLRLSSNPFNQILTIDFPEYAESSEIWIFDSCGRVVFTDTCEDHITWNGQDTDGRHLPPGLYSVYAVINNEDRLSARVILIE
ncbi:MAG: hypothetical protein GF388_01830 [Candidatus Aegiribacteria sp.]|nr:hypothetical protein [Candidatus Aegiribacteria sp.]